MFVITADQVGSRDRPDLVARHPGARSTSASGTRSRCPVDRNAGDEVQALTADAGTALADRARPDPRRRLERRPRLAATCAPRCRTRPARRPATPSSRRARPSTRAKRRPTRFAVEAVVDAAAADDAEALLDLLLTLREGRTAAGWELYDLVAAGLTQAEAGARLGITPQSASDRARAAGLRVELAAIRTAD